MIYLLYGDNEFEKRAVLAALVGDMEVVRRDGEELTATEVCEVVMGQSLFAVKQAVVITDASQNVALWRDLPELLGDTATTVVLLETKLDKRTKTYKWLQNHAEVTECAHFTERQKPQLSAWCVERATVHGAVLTARQATTLIDRLGFDQLRLDLVLQQLALAGELNDELIDALVPLAPAESAFELFAAMLDGDRGKVRVITAYLEAESGDDGAYQTLGLLVSQLVQLNALVLSGGDTEAVARDFAAHPYALRKVASYAARMTQAQLAVINSALAQADEQMKTTRVSPWLLVETALVGVIRRDH
ncbi:DNA polymerase III subunit delta [Candidatus Saccharibacteria bacterium oral taxon 488]|nr:DNA polymerase III subunit delta [Candidatus Saccharibacteria bacterium oral taxon 488]